MKQTNKQIVRLFVTRGLGANAGWEPAKLPSQLAGNKLYNLEPMYYIT